MKNKITLLITLIFLVVATSGFSDEVKRGPVTGILGAMPVEVQMLESQLQGKKTEKILGVEFHSGVLNGRNVVIAVGGIGKVNAAMTATLLIDHFRPSEVIFSGVAGGLNPDLAPGDIVLGEKTAQHDYGEITASGFSPQPTGKDVPLFMNAPERLLSLAEAAAKDAALEKVPTTQGERFPRVIRGVIVTGDVFVADAAKTDALRKMFKADAVEMEGASVTQVCWKQNVPCLIIRCVCDKADASAGADFEHFLKSAAANSSKLTMSLMRLLAKEQ
ncbi:MAG: 5'-methylthioadenosine/adenosylhomocysteine nucleosidase [Victivallales bacterium]|jgi:adenosylhomocysteine nucleosidase